MSDNTGNDDIERLVIERMGHISSELAHDLRSPLQTIQNAIYLLEKSPDNTMLFDMIRQSLKQATYLLDSFREYYKGHVINPIETEYSKIVDLAFSDLDIPENIKVTRNGDQSVLVRVDPAKTALAVRNIVINACDAMPDGGEINIAIKNNGDSVELFVQDSGLGIPPEHENTLFVPFETTKKGGKGLGLPTAQRVIESHGGSISYTTKVGEGTVFSVSLPVSTETL